MVACKPRAKDQVCNFAGELLSRVRCGGINAKMSISRSLSIAFGSNQQPGKANGVGDVIWHVALDRNRKGAVLLTNTKDLTRIGWRSLEQCCSLNRPDAKAE